jgi:hypothetical protein
MHYTVLTILADGITATGIKCPHSNCTERMETKSLRVLAARGALILSDTLAPLTLDEVDR